MSQLIFFGLLMLLPTFAQGEDTSTDLKSDFYIAYDQDSNETVLNVKYMLQCPSDVIPYFVVENKGFNSRVYLFPQTTSAQSLVFPLREGLIRIKPVSLSLCKSVFVKVEARPVHTDKKSKLVSDHSPVIVFRDDQIKKANTDLPLVLAHHFEKPTPDTTRLVYTMIFSDEDSKESRAETEGHMARYGRRTDIEWVYAVTFDYKWNILSREYQGLLHFPKSFRGAFIEGTQHPLLYNRANNNIFSDSPSDLQQNHPIASAMTSTYEIFKPEAREMAMFANPWTFRVSDLELKKEKRLTYTSRDYLYIQIQGELSGLLASFQAVLTLSDGRKFYSGNGQSTVDRLGEDTWHAESFTAIPVGRKILNALQKGELKAGLTFLKTGPLKTELIIKELNFYRLQDNTLGSYDPVLFLNWNCHYQGLNTKCSN